MKIAARKSNKKPLLITAAIIIALAIAGGAYWWYTHNSPANNSMQPSVAPTNTVNYGPPTTQDQSDSDAAKQNGVNNSGQTTNASLTVSITRASQVGSTVSVRTIVTGADSCDMTFTKDGQASITKNFAITQGPTSVSCNGDIPSSTFSVSGDWKLSVVAKSGTSISTAATQTVSVSK